MEPEIVKNDTVVETEEIKVEKTEPAEVTPSNEQWLLVGYRISAFVEKLPGYFSYFFDAYKQPLIVIGSIVGVFVAFKLMLALVSALNDLPLIAGFLELVGLAYATWFVYRYLISTESRQELSAKFQEIREYVLGK
ncbi:MAG: CAAD domain-containing protein [Coleofasciculaceae cyanobacterium]